MEIYKTLNAVYKNFAEFFTTEGIDEIRRFLADSARQTFGELKIKPKEGYILDDPHVHYPKSRSREDLESLVRIMASRLGRTSITTWLMGENDKETLGREDDEVRCVLKYSDLVEQVRSLSKDISIDNRREVSIISVGERKLQVYPCWEIKTTSPIKGFYPHITAEGCLKPIEPGQDTRKVIDLIHEQGGLANIEHITTRPHPLLQFTLTSPEENDFLNQLCYTADSAEVFNSYNTLWMLASNAYAKRMFADQRIPKTAGSDLHFGRGSILGRYFHRKRIGKVGIWLPEHDLTGLTGREILEQKRQDLKDGNFERLETYTDPMHFFFTMIAPRFQEMFIRLKEKIRK
ncbi:MAG: hypothetical protein AABW58_03205 [Nanoarchaeota archaeon]